MKKTYTGSTGITLSYAVREPRKEKAALYILLSGTECDPLPIPGEDGSIAVWCENPLWEEDVCRAVGELCHRLAEAWNADENRLYLLGEDEGAAGIWAMLPLFPRLFAACVPVGGYGDPYKIRVMRAGRIWAFAKENGEPESPKGGVDVDGKMMLAGARNMILSLRGQGHQGVRCDAWTGENVFARTDVLSWLAEQSRVKQLEIEYIQPGLWGFEDYFHSSAYLLEGKDRALLIDTGMAEVDFKSAAEGCTRLPITLVVTHAHRDHDGNAWQFDEVYMHEDDIEMEKKHYAASKTPTDGQIKPEAFRPLADGQIIDLGGGIEVKAVKVWGHTPGSLVFVCEKLGLVFSGDAIGSGEVVLLYGRQDRGCLREVMTKYRGEVEHLLDEIRNIPDPMFFGGHKYQDSSCDHIQWERVYSGGVDYYNPLCREVAEDMRDMCTEIIEGRLQEEPREQNDGWLFRYRRAGILYLFRK